jgi:hypothetical protein
MTAANPWPELSYGALKDTAQTLQLWTQVVGKVRLTLTPWLNHSWHVPLYVTARGLSTGVIPHPAGPSFDIEFDFVDARLDIRSTDGGRRTLALEAMPVASFYIRCLMALADLGLPVMIHGAPNELPTATRFALDLAPRVYEPEQALAFWRALVQAQRVLARFRTAFLGKASPVHFFWGSFDLAVTRFSGRPAPPHPGGVPHLPDAVAREAYSHEVSSAGFWPGGGAIDYPAFYAYAYPEPPGFRAAPLAPQAAFFSQALGEYILPYEAVRTAADPDGALIAFLQSTYAAAADTGGWDRAALECDIGAPGRPRPT